MAQDAEQPAVESTGTVTLVHLDLVMARAIVSATASHARSGSRRARRTPRAADTHLVERFPRVVIARLGSLDERGNRGLVDRILCLSADGGGVTEYVFPKSDPRPRFQTGENLFVNPPARQRRDRRHQPVDQEDQARRARLPQLRQLPATPPVALRREWQTPRTARVRGRQPRWSV